MRNSAHQLQAFEINFKMNQYNIVLAVLFSLLGVSKSDITGGTYQRNKFGKGLRKTVINNKGPKMCVKECLHANGCSAVNFDKANLKCELLFDEGSTPATTDKEGYMYTDIHHWLMPVNPCWPENPCEKLQKCVSINQNGGFTCVPIPVKKVCNEGWKKIDGHCYFFSPPDQKLDFNSAKAACENDGGYLIEINSAEEHEWLRIQLNMEYGNVDDYCWMGLQYRPDDASWVSTRTGKPISYTSWCHVCPDGDRDPTSHAYIAISLNDGTWHNTYATYEKNYVCKK